MNISDLSASSQDALKILIEVEAVDNATPVLKEIAKETTTLGNESRSVWTMSQKDAEKYTDELRNSVVPIRSVSWDLMLMGRSLSIVNTTFFGGNQQLKEFIGYMYGVSAIIRIGTSAMNFYALAVETVAWLRAKDIIGLGVEGVAVSGLTTKYAGLAIAKGVATGGTSLIPGVIGGLGAMGALGMAGGAGLTGFAKGGYVGQTGPYILHKGETVIPAGGSNFNVININMNSGPISSGVDVDNMLDAMAKRMIVESRRRG